MYLCVSVVVVVACRCVYGRNRRGVGGMWWLLMCFGAHACVCVQACVKGIGVAVICSKMSRGIRLPVLDLIQRS